MSFASLGLSEALARAVAAAGYASPTPVQQRAIPAVLQGRDLMVAAQTGTGKTGGFALPILEQLFPAGHPDREHRHGPRQARVLVLTPTRELAAQVHDSFRLYARDLPLNSTCIFGGVGMNPQVQALSKGVDVLVACPGRLLDLAQQKAVDLSHVEILVLDEADRMLDMGFIHDVKKVLARLPAKRQNLLFSATFSKDITDLADKLLHNPERIEVTPPNTTVERIDQFVYRLPAVQKRALLAHLITLGAWEQVLVFTRTKHGANRLAEYLCKQGLPAAAIHGNKSQNARTKALADFKASSVRVLVATDIAARGLDIDQLPHVVNYELPNVEEDYVHRIGRTGRAGRTGAAISLVSPDEEKLLKSIERLTRQRIPDGDSMGFDPAAVVEVPVAAAPEQDEAARSQRKGHSRGRKDRPAHDQKPQATASEDGAEQKPARNRRRKGEKAEQPAAAAGEGKARGSRERSTAQPPTQGQSQGRGRNRQDKAAVQASAGQQSPSTRNDRDPEEFLDDDYDNFGNSVDYVSPYQGSGRGNRQGNKRGQTQGQTQGRAQSQAQGQAATQGRGKRTQGQSQAGQDKRRGGGGRKPVPSLMSDAPLREPGTPAVRGPRDSQPVILHKPSRHERLPSAAQLEELEQLERQERKRGERPALLTRNKQG